MLYKLIDSDSDNSKFVLFPGYNNLDLFGNIVNVEDNDGTEDEFVNFNKDGVNINSMNIHLKMLIRLK